MNSDGPQSWAEDAFDRVRANAEAFGGPLSEAGIDGLRRAMDQTLRFTDLFSQAPPVGRNSFTEGFDEESYRRFRVESERLIDAFLDATRSSLVTFMTMADEFFLSDSADRRAQRDSVRMAPVVAGETTVSTLWLRAEESPLVGVKLEVDDLTEDAGDIIPARQVTLSPNEIDLIEAHSRYAVSVRVETREHNSPGLYSGHIMSKGIPTAALVAEIVPRTI